MKIHLQLVISLFTCYLVAVVPLAAQQSIRSFIFGHSLINHELQVHPTPSQETSVPHWLHYLSQAGGHTYAVSGQYGFLPQHASNLPPIAQWGFDVVTPVWDSDNEPFSDADFNQIMITPGNFIQWQGPEEMYFSDPTPPVDASLVVFNWCLDQEENLRFLIYENWPDMGGYLSNGFPPSPTEWTTYNDYLQGDFHEWFIEYHDLIRTQFSDHCIAMVPVGPIISNLLSQSPFDEIPLTELYEDDAPHGRPTLYFLAAMITYGATYEEPLPNNFNVDNIIHPIIRDNYQMAADFIWEQLNSFLDEQQNSRVFCDRSTNLGVTPTETNTVKIGPNPTSGWLQLEGRYTSAQVSIFDPLGRPVLRQEVSARTTLDISNWPSGTYFIRIEDTNGYLLHQSSILLMTK